MLMHADDPVSIMPLCRHPRVDCIQDFFTAHRVPLKLHRVLLPELETCEITMDLVRDDLLHPMIAGNKWWKLKYALVHAAERGIPTLVTFGGAYSNHLLAVAAAGHLFGFKTVGLVRGEATLPLNPVLALAEHWGMHLEYLTRAQYRLKHMPDFLNRLEVQWEPCLVLPEGGSGPFAVEGTREMVQRLTAEPDFLCCPVGTGGTLAGMVASAGTGVSALGFSALKGGRFLEDEVRRLLADRSSPSCSWSIETRYHFGGYAKSDATLRHFCRSFERSQGVCLDFIYTGKMMYGLVDLVKKGFFPKGTHIAAWHTGNASGPSVSGWGKSIQGLSGIGFQQKNDEMS